MKRSPMKRSTKPMKRTAWLRTSGPAMTRTPMKSRRKSVVAHAMAYFKRVAALPCAQCGIHGFSQAAHSNRQQDGKGLGLKANYLATFPLCCTRPGEIGCHARHDQCIGMTRAEADKRTERYIADTIRRLA